MSYMLYKQAEGEEKKPDAKDGKEKGIDPKDLAKILGGVGGGALGYLTTRYLLGLKGFMPGVIGAGTGAAGGVLGASYLQDLGGKQNEHRQDMLDRAMVENWESTQKSAPEEFVGAAGESYTTPGGLVTQGLGTTTGIATANKFARGASEKTTERRANELIGQVDSIIAEQDANTGLMRNRHKLEDYEDRMTTRRTPKGKKIKGELLKNTRKKTDALRRAVDTQLEGYNPASSGRLGSQYTTSEINEALKSLRSSPKQTHRQAEILRQLIQAPTASGFARGARSRAPKYAVGGALGSLLTALAHGALRLNGRGNRQKFVDENRLNAKAIRAIKARIAAREKKQGK